MATSLLALLDDITTLLDDVASMTKVATQKTAGVLGDDLALNAQQVSGVDPSRELPVVWEVAKGSALNKAILVPAALAISALAPWAITPLLMIGGAFLCFEGVEKIAHKLLHSAEHDAEEKKKLEEAFHDPQQDLVAVEKEKIKGAIRTDFILSAEIVVIALGTVPEATFTERLLVLVAISGVMTFGVYGLVAGIVKLDDLGLALKKRDSGVAQGVGEAILVGAPYLMRFLSFAGTLAMFLVGGGILVHGIPQLHHLEKDIHHMGGMAAAIGPSLLSLVVGLVVGAALVLVFTAIQKARGVEAH